MKKKTEFFNSAFEGLAPLIKKNRIVRNPPQEQKPPEQQPETDETRDFLEAVSNVQPFSDGPKRVTRIPNLEVRPSHPAGSDELEAIMHLSDLVTGTAEIDITFSDEYIEGSVHGFSRTLMNRLKKGQLPVQDYVDLHGLTKQEAEIRMRDFILQCHRFGLRCVLVVHGRGLNSENHIPVLKERLPIWLSRGPLKKIVLAFSTARSYDGGTGAIYVLLRKQK
ncbi:MAG: Smr/MutS family protein [Thermodesulfobacteriota bacterium]|nr:Smr/MutS family protein [Thermodesulfobacteriota bacterium]